MKKSFKKSVTKLIVGGVALFVFGIFIGYQLNNNSILSLQGFLFNALSEATDGNATDGNATDGNATDGNATDGNATDGNATDGNATDANATNANAQISDNVIYLYDFGLESLSAKPGDKVYVDLLTGGADFEGANILFKSTSNDITFTAEVTTLVDRPFIIIPENVLPSTYNISKVLLIGLNSDNTTFTKQYSSETDTAEGSYYYNFDTSLVIQDTEPKNTPVVKVQLNSISLEKDETLVNEKVYIKYNSNLELSSLKLKFVDDNSKEMIAYVQSLKNQPYFEIPSSAESGTYKLVSATLVSATSTVVYTIDGNTSGSVKFAFNSTLTVKEMPKEETKMFVYNNEDITDEVIAKLYKADSDSTINIKADSSPILSSELFNSIKGTSKKLVVNYNDNQVIFDGNNISNVKSIDATMSSHLLDNTSNAGKLVSDGVLLNFASNKDLPGKALVRVKITTEMANALKNRKAYVYYYNQSCNDFSEIATDVEPTSDGYYEFTITHNSEYIMVTKALDSSLIAKTTDDVVSFQKSNKIYFLLIGLGFLVIAGVTGLILMIRKGSKTSVSTTNKK